MVTAILGGASLVAGLGSSLFGASKARKAAREQRRLLREQRAKNDAWYMRNYYRDYIDTVAGQNAIKQTRDAWRKATQEARARQAITGGTPEQAQAVAEAGGDAMARTIGNLAAQGEANKHQIDAQKAAMDANIAAQEGAIANARQQAGANMMENGIGLAVQGASSLLGSIPAKHQAPTAPQMQGIPYEEVPPLTLPDRIQGL